MAQSKGDFTFTGARFSGDKVGDYGSASLSYRLNPHFRLVSRLTSSKFRMFDGGGFVIIDGGREFEEMGYFNFGDAPGVEVGIGASCPDTNDRGKQSILTYDIGWTRPSGRNKFRFGLRGLATGSNMGMLSVQATHPLNNSWLSLDAFFGAMVWGENTRSTLSGKVQDIPIGRLGVLAEPAGPFHAELAITNQLGMSTGFSMTPILGNRYGISLMVGVRF